jgi:glycosyltransferase involved in cell wall biosynthesis
MYKLISIIVPCFNQCQFLPDALDSVLNQSYKNWECIIVDDGSIDSTKEISIHYCNLDNRIHYYYIENSGLSTARNYGINHSIGEYILPLDADDIIAPQYLNIATSILDNNDKIKMVYCIGQMFGYENRIWDLPEYDFQLLLKKSIIFCSGVYRRVDFNKTSGYSIDMKYGLEDWEFWISLLKNGGIVHRITDVLFYYRTKEISMANSLSREKLDYLQRVVYEKHRASYDEFFNNPIHLINVVDELNFELEEYKRKIKLIENSLSWKLLKYIRNILRLD